MRSIITVLKEYNGGPGDVGYTAKERRPGNPRAFRVAHPAGNETTSLM